MSRLSRLDLPEIKTLIALTTEDTRRELAQAWDAPAVTPDACAYLQYTSGSTSSRKGVILRHHNVIANIRAIAERFEHSGESVCVNWLPHIHDLGLVNGILHPLLYGHCSVLISPNAFVQQPIRWLDAITRFRGTYSSSPNFGYDLCVRRTTPEQRARLDLGSWRIALNGAEPVRQQTIDAFAEMFSARARTSADDLEGGVDPAEFQEYFVKKGRFTAGTAIRYRPSIISARHSGQS